MSGIRSFATKTSPLTKLCFRQPVQSRAFSTVATKAFSPHPLSRNCPASAIPRQTLHGSARPLQAFLPFRASPSWHARPTYYNDSPVSSLTSRQRSRASGGGGGGWGPNNQWRRRIDGLPSNYILFGLIGANVAVFCSWQYGTEVYRKFRDPRWLQTLQNNFTVSYRNFTEGRIWTLFTATLSHEGGGHILVNMLSLFFMAPPVMAILGNSGFLALYIFSGIASSAFSLLWHQLFDRKSIQGYSSHGASGAVYGALTFFAASFPRTTFLIFFVIPCPAWLCVSGLFAFDLYSSLYRPYGMTDSAGHIGGVLAGLAFYLRRKGRF